MGLGFTLKIWGINLNGELHISDALTLYTNWNLKFCSLPCCIDGIHFQIGCKMVNVLQNRFRNKRLRKLVLARMNSVPVDGFAACWAGAAGAFQQAHEKGEDGIREYEFVA